MSLQDEADVFIAMCYAGELQKGTQEHLNVEAAFIAGAARAAMMIHEATSPEMTIAEISQAAEDYIEAGLAAEAAGAIKKS